MTFRQSISTCFRKYVTFSGRAARSEYWWFFLFCLLAGIVVGYLYSVLGWQEFTVYTDWIGTIFINLVKMVVVPLVVVSLILGAASLGDIKKVGKMGAKAFGFFLFTTAIAVAIGLAVANVMRPGDNLPEDKRELLIGKYQSD